VRILSIFYVLFLSWSRIYSEFTCSLVIVFLYIETYVILFYIIQYTRCSPSPSLRFLSLPLSLSLSLIFSFNHLFLHSIRAMFLWPATNIFLHFLNLWHLLGVLSDNLTVPIIDMPPRTYITIVTACPSLPQLMWKTDPKITLARYKYVDLWKVLHHQPPHSPPMVSTRVATCLQSGPITSVATLFDRSAAKHFL
jgi:hypothetical protein